MSVANTYTESSDTPLPQVAARAARRAIRGARASARARAAARTAMRPRAMTRVQTVAWWALTLSVMTAMSALFALLIGGSFH